MNTLTDKEKVWERLKHVPMFPGTGISFDVNSLYPFAMNALSIKRVKGDPESVTIKVLKNRP